MKDVRRHVFLIEVVEDMPPHSAHQPLTNPERETWQHHVLEALSNSAATVSGIQSVEHTGYRAQTVPGDYQGAVDD